jgi:ABC-2 type transport system ATP-binding protein
METAIECSNITRVFGSRNPLTKKQQVKALDGLDLSIPRGIVFSLLGPNGSGKTTTIRIVSTLLTPTSGKPVCWVLIVLKKPARSEKKSD